MIAPNSGYAPLNKGHKAMAGSRNFCRYSIYDNRTDMPIIIDGTAKECAEAFGTTTNSFYCMVNRVRLGKNKRYTVLTRMLDEPEEDMEEAS